MATGTVFYHVYSYMTGLISAQQIDFTADTFKFILTDTAPVTATNTKYSDISANELTTGSGYTAGGAATTITVSYSGGANYVTATSVTWTASGGSIGPFRYIVFYDDTLTDKPLIEWWDFGSEVTITSGNDFQHQPAGSSVSGVILALG